MIPAKPTLRATLKAARRGIDLPFAVPPAFNAELAPGMIVASYLPTADEPDPAPFEQAALAAGCTVALPHVVDRPTPLRFLARGAGALVAGPFGLLNPPPHWRAVAPDLFLTPLVGFDRRGHRLGHGAGHYDRAFADHPAARRIGMAWSVQEVPALPADPWDVPLHAIATERAWIVVA